MKCCSALPVLCGNIHQPKGHYPGLKKQATGQMQWDTYDPTSHTSQSEMYAIDKKYVILNNSNLLDYWACLSISFASCFDLNSLWLLFILFASYRYLMGIITRQKHATQNSAWCIFYFLNWRWKRELFYSIVFCLSDSIFLDSNSTLLENETHYWVIVQDK